MFVSIQRGILPSLLWGVWKSLIFQELRSRRNAIFARSRDVMERARFAAVFLAGLRMELG